MESLRYDVEPLRVDTTIVEPGYFRTELLVDGSSIWPELSIDDYAERTAQTIAAMKGMNGAQPRRPGQARRRTCHPHGFTRATAPLGGRRRRDASRAAEGAGAP